MAKAISDTHNFVQRLTEDAVFSKEQAERLKEVIGDEIDVVTKNDMERALQRQTVQFLTAMLAQTVLHIAAVQWITNV